MAHGILARSVTTGSIRVSAAIDISLRTIRTIAILFSSTKYLGTHVLSRGCVAHG